MASAPLQFEAADHPLRIDAAVRGLLRGDGPPLLLGTPVASAQLPRGTGAVVTTSGSTGIPKSVVLSRAALEASALATETVIGSGQWMLALAPTYVAGLQVLVRGALAEFAPSMLAGKFSPEAFVTATAELSGTRNGEMADRFTSLVPAQLTTLLDAAEQQSAVAMALRSYRAVLIGGQALAIAERERARELGVRIVRTYGSSETAGGCVYNGHPLPGVKLSVYDGEVRVAGNVLADGYLGDAKRTQERFVRDNGTRWYRTGDAGTLTDGVLGITGRLDNVLISGGVNVSLDAVEAVVRGVAGFADAVVVAVDSERWGQVPQVVTATGHEDALAEVREAVQRVLGVAARPDSVRRVPEIPLLPSGKPDRRSLTSMRT